MPTEDHPEETEAETEGSVPDLVGLYQRIAFENGLEVSLQEDGTLRVIATGRGLKSITIHPSTDCSCRIGTIGKLIKPND